MKAICHGKAAGTGQEEGREAGEAGSSAPPQPRPVQLLCECLCEAVPPPLPLGPYISTLETIPTSTCAFLQLDLNCCTKISSQNHGFRRAGVACLLQSIFPRLPTHHLFMSEARGRGPRPVAQCVSAAWRVLHHHFCVSICGLTKPCASHPRGKTKSESWSTNLTAFGFPAFGFPVFGGIWSFWLGNLSSPHRWILVTPKPQPRHGVGPPL